MAESENCANFNFDVEKPTNCDFVRYEQRPAFTVVGPQETMTFPEIVTKMPGVVKSFTDKNSEIKNTKDNKTCYGISFDASEKGFTYLLGKEVTKVEDVPEGFTSREVPSNEYAVVGYKGAKDKLQDTYVWFSSKWLTEKGHEFVMAPSFEMYDERHIPGGPDVDKSYFEIYLPIKKNSQ